MAKYAFLIFLLLTFGLGLLFFVENTYCPLTEGFDTQSPQGMDTQVNTNCPNLLVRKNGVLLMYNTNKPVVDGFNPIPFYNLDEYINYVNVKRNVGEICPILFLQHEVNTQGDEIYRARPSPFDMQGGLPTNVPLVYKEDTNKMLVPYLDSNNQNPPYNVDHYSGFDPYGQHIGQITELDILHKSTQRDVQSKNPMDTNWGGVLFTQHAVERGDYKGREVNKNFEQTHPGAV
jgi:hypothetical protein